MRYQKKEKKETKFERKRSRKKAKESWDKGNSKQLQILDILYTGYKNMF